MLSKLLTEEAAFKFANEHGLNLVSVITTTVAGPFLTSTVPSSIRVLLSPITGSILLFSRLFMSLKSVVFGYKLNQGKCVGRFSKCGMSYIKLM